ncbi:hypothetical protein sscle_06g049490 [Sclerotinia sclerotiorum 1980 UF-70]|uniref:Uncharacterized protein n=1 Tax=Sclerotinia sclerotiorum (strain ATCC 18683 / 1980 / Ss-1) TaxID=665079 RepID=A0A1D9Q5K5_SCLS1|nr:hypothetical protein sscle_06g049490 [Sclerotinia sclerotiorum 1980 UF-70]
MTTHLISTELSLLDRPTQPTTAITINGLVTCEDSSTHPTEEDMECRRLESLPDCSIQRGEEEVRLERLNLSDASQDLRRFAAKKVRNKSNCFMLGRENCTLKLAERKKSVKNRSFAAYTNYQKKLRVHLYKRETLMDMLGPLGMTMDWEERNKFFKGENEQLRALRKESGEELLNAWHAVQDSAQELREETRERLLKLMDGEGEIATGLKKRLDEIDEWETQEEKEYKTAMMKLHKEWEASKKAMRFKGELLGVLSRYS